MTSDKQAQEKRKVVEDAFSAAASTYTLSPFFTPSGQRLVELAGIRGGQRVLDVATGRGAVLWPALQNVGPDGFVEGIDLASPMVELTREDLRSRNVTNARVQLMDAERLAFEDGIFDAVLCGFVLWFIPGLDGALEEMIRVSKPGASFAATTWSPPQEMQLRLVELMRRHGAGLDNLASHSLATTEALEAAVKQAGFEAVRAFYEDVSAVFAGPEDWWYRAVSRPQLVHMLSSEQVQQLKSEVLSLAHEHKRGDGTIVQARRVTFVGATTPAK